MSNVGSYIVENIEPAGLAILILALLGLGCLVLDHFFHPDSKCRGPGLKDPFE